MEQKTFIYCFLHNFDGIGKGIKNKIFDQLKALKNLNFETHLLTVTDKSLTLDKTSISLSNNKYLIKLLSPFKAYKLINRKYDYLYVRGFGLDPMLFFFLKKTRKYFGKIIYEIPTYPYDIEISSRGIFGKIYLLIDKSLRKKLKKYVDFIVNVDEYREIWGIPAIPIHNCIDTSTVEFTGYVKKENKELNILGVAGLRVYHGYDRIIKGIAEYYNAFINNNGYEIYFHIVGVGIEEKNLKNLVKTLNLESRIIFHGALYNEQLTNIFKKSQIAIGSLGMHKIHLEKGSVLKVREYFARGIPFVIAYDDIAIRELEKYYLKVENNDDPIDIVAIIKWYESLNFNPIEMRDIAENIFSWEKQFSIMFNTIHSYNRLM